MAYINKGDLLVSRYTNVKYIAESDDYVKRFAGTGEFLDDWSFELCVNTLNPEDGSRGWIRVSDVVKV